MPVAIRAPRARRTEPAPRRSRRDEPAPRRSRRDEPAPRRTRRDDVLVPRRRDPRDEPHVGSTSAAPAFGDAFTRFNEAFTRFDELFGSFPTHINVDMSAEDDEEEEESYDYDDEAHDCPYHSHYDSSPHHSPYDSHYDSHYAAPEETEMPALHPTYAEPCPICLDTIRVPAALSTCGHSFCHSCIQRVTPTRRGTPCPVCRDHGRVVKL